MATGRVGHRRFATVLRCPPLGIYLYGQGSELLAGSWSAGWLGWLGWLVLDD